ncbi:hypothetical protein PF005_g18168 [Phytophthora fragariae]|uniref:Uncharacterized protein n=1 Tax=Phytophthora fragariae TaxID=53985 RepID=A0A6A3RC16_9STRA|nr:hypothetical protein PF003_g20525 [Phytophthora fragariae]KAE8993660.1 hypothetical protein PF011_g17050 [Phytophthora fragariae]KAE9092653.1 hypothetical protein PF007_g18403 [Phytophthora fragariae]KAE9093092.1 hypothetical protein PF010_g17625 [Phytophthora fragariae]KAE9124461.1 hypothetical protein PF006_g17187 [Phytophthora fragariae]
MSLLMAAGVTPYCRAHSARDSCVDGSSRLAMMSMRSLSVSRRPFPFPTMSPS